MRKNLPIFLLGVILLFACGNAAAEINSLTFLDAANAQVDTHLLKSVQKLTFDGDNVVIHKIDGTKKSHLYDDLSKFIFTEHDDNTTSISDPTIELSKGISVTYDASAQVLKITATQLIFNVLIVDLSGRTVSHTSPSVNECEVGVSYLSPGVYALVVNTSTEKKIVKFAVK